MQHSEMRNLFFFKRFFQSEYHTPIIICCTTNFLKKQDKHRYCVFNFAEIFACFRFAKLIKNTLQSIITRPVNCIGVK